MRIMVRGAHLPQFESACAEFGYQVQANQTMSVWFGAGDQDTLSEYVMPDDLALATWIVMRHPEWLHEIWQQGNPVIIDDSQETFQRLQALNG
jgi:hypothetical protein